MHAVKTILTYFLFLWIQTGVIAQVSFYGPDGVDRLPVSNQKILIEFKPGTDFKTQSNLLSKYPEIGTISREMVLPGPLYTLVPLQKIKATDVPSLLKRLQKESTILYAGAFLAHPDGTLQGITRRAIVGLTKTADILTLREVIRQYGGEIIENNSFDPLMYHVEARLDAGISGLQLANKLYETGIFAYAEPDFLRLMPRLSTNDPLVGSQWSLNNDGTNTSTWGGVAGSDLNVFNAWTVTTGSSSIKVAILDEGVDLNHSDLLANLEPGYDATGNGSAGGPSGNDAHGTACAGIVAAVGNNSLGLAGVAYGCRIIPVRLAYSSGSSWVTSNTIIANALNWAWQTGNADVLSNSWGGGSTSSAINSAIDGALANGRGGLGAPVLFAAGNSNGSVIYPASYAPTIAVIAMSMCDQRKNPASCDGETWWGSCYGTNADIAAPGVKIVTTDISGTSGYNTGDYTTSFNGTSSACPNAAGVMALILSKAPYLTASQARYTIESTCAKVGGYTYVSGQTGQPNGTWSTDLGYGRVDAFAAVSSLVEPVEYDAGIRSITSPSGVVCDSTTKPMVVLMNYGSNTLDSVTINYQLDSNPLESVTWTGPLPAGTSTDVLLPSISLGGGNHSLVAYTSNPNGQNDNNTSNDTVQSTFYSGIVDLTLTITLDNYPSETSWVIKDTSNNSILVAGGGYSSSNSTVTETFCLPTGCFEFIIYDTYGDGICCNFGEGSYSLENDLTGEILAEGGQFGFSDTTLFCVSLATAYPNDAGITEIINPTGLLCTPSDTPLIVLKNFGSDTLQAVNIHYQLNSGQPQTFAWTGALPPYLTTQVTLPAITFNSYTDTLQVNTSLPNGQADGRTNNDTMINQFRYADIDIILTIKTDLYPGETSWEIRDSAGTRIVRGGDYKDANTAVVENLCVTTGCFDFYIFDSYGDGICCSFGNGSYALVEPISGDTLASGGSFSNSEVTNFCFFGPPEPPNCPDSLLLADATLIDPLYQAGSFLSSAGLLEAPDSTTLQAGSQVVLLPGFTAEPGSFLTVKIATCVLLQNPGETSEFQEASPHALAGKKNKPNPKNARLKCFPNPFQSTTTVEFELPEPTEMVALYLVDATGKTVSTLLQSTSTPAGIFRQTLGLNLKPGMYFLILQTDQYKLVEKMITF